LTYLSRPLPPLWPGLWPGFTGLPSPSVSTPARPRSSPR
jgi:hypothetical protein